jgi:hypothetical protein
MIRRKTKIKSMTPEKAARRKADRELKAVNDVGALIGLPDAQRTPGRVEIVTVQQVGHGPRVTEQTIRKLTRVEMLHRHGVLTADEAAACEWYADQAAMAWDTSVGTSSYEPRSGGGSATAPDRLMAKNIEIASARSRYAAARAAIPEALAPLFEAVVCRNELIGEAAARAFTEVKQRAAYNRAQQALKTCAAKVRDVMEGRRPDPVRQGLAETMLRFDSHVRAEKKVEQGIRISDQIADGILRVVNATTLHISPAVHDAIMRENKLDAIEVFGGLPVEVVEHWGWGWIVGRDG